MPGFGGSLSNEARWDLIDYLRAHNAGVSMRTTGRWSHPVPVPQFDLACAEGQTIDLDDLRGRVLHIVAESRRKASVHAADRHRYQNDHPYRADPPSRTTACVASEPETWTAFAILSGVSSDALAGEQVLADQNAWLRARGGCRSRDLSNPQALGDAIRNIAAHPLQPNGGRTRHRH